jgi:cytochrome c oxidase subunit 3
MSFYRDVTNKPWNTVGLPEGIEARPAFNMPNEKVALIIFATCASVLFSLLVVSYFIRMTVGDWVPLATPAMLWVNTAALLLSSVCFHFAVVQARSSGSVRFGSAAGVLSLAGGVLAILFVAGQYSVSVQLLAAGHGLRVNAANAFFYLLTGIHVVHLLGGLWVWGKAQVRLARGTNADDARLSLELCAWYWHFLLVIWACLFYLLAST